MAHKTPMKLTKVFHYRALVSMETGTLLFDEQSHRVVTFSIEQEAFSTRLKIFNKETTCTYRKKQNYSGIKQLNHFKHMYLTCAASHAVVWREFRRVDYPRMPTDPLEVERISLKTAVGRNISAHIPQRYSAISLISSRRLVERHLHYNSVLIHRRFAREGTIRTYHGDGSAEYMSVRRRLPRPSMDDRGHVDSYGLGIVGEVIGQDDAFPYPLPQLDAVLEYSGLVDGECVAREAGVDLQIDPERGRPHVASVFRHAEDETRGRHALHASALHCKGK